MNTIRRTRVYTIFISIVTLVILGSFFLFHNSAEAQFGARVPVVDEEHIEVSGAILQVLSQLLEKEFVLDPEQEADAKEVLADDTEAETEFIRTGFRGYMANRYLPINPYSTSVFEDDLSQYFKDVVDSEFNRFLIENAGLDLNSGDLNPERLPGQYLDVVSLILVEQKEEGESFRDSYTLDDITGSQQNAEDFISGDFEKGGWSAWHALTQNPNNNIYGTYERSLMTIVSETESAAAEQSKLLDYGQGFHAIQSDAGLVVTPSTITREKLDRAIATCTRSLEAVDEFTGEEGSLGKLPNRLEQMCDQLQQGLNNPNGGLLSVVFDFGNLFGLDFSSIVGSILGSFGLGGLGGLLGLF